MGRLVEDVRRVSIDRVCERLGVASPPSAGRIALYGWVCFSEAATLEWLSHDDVTDEALIAILVDALHPVLRVLRAPQEA